MFTEGYDNLYSIQSMSLHSPHSQALSSTHAAIQHRMPPPPASHLGLGHSQPPQHYHQPHILPQPSTPTPSDISSIHATPRNAISVAGFSDKSIPCSSHTAFLEPGQILKPESWNAYKVLPAVGQGGVGSIPGTMETTDNVPGSATSHNNGSLNSLSPFSFPDFSPGGSNLTSPRHSARLAKKRARSTSTLSSEGLDLLSMIRSSPTALLLCGSHGSSSGNGSPHFNQGVGSFGHVSARSSGDSSHLAPHFRVTSKDISQMAGGSCDYHPMDSDKMLQGGTMVGSNQMLIQQNLEQLLGLDQLLQTSNLDNKPSPGETYSQVPAVTLTSTVPSETANIDSMLPPPPPYSEAVGQHSNSSQAVPTAPTQYTSLSQLSPTTTNNNNGGIKTELKPSEVVEEEAETQCLHMCKWMDCNQVFEEKDELVRHIERQHIDQRRGEDFTCYWQGCSRKYKPFNARYKLLIHMRVHSGEKPNKCTVSAI